MPTHRNSLRAAALALAVSLLAGPTLAFSGRGERSGPIYSSPESIAYVQDVLVKTGDLEANGFKRGEQDAATLRATRQFQRRHFLRPSGRIDFDTMALLSSHATTPKD